MNRRDILRRAASLICGPGAYSRHAEDPACVAVTRTWSATGAIERSARPLRSGAWMLGPTSPALDEAKAAVCRVVGHPHIDTWEAVERPDWQRVRDVFAKAAA
jgi:hypothetical protein